MTSIAFFNNKGGVGKTSLAYHLAWMFSDLGYKTLAVDWDPQSNLTSMFLPEERLEEIWPPGPHPQAIFGAIEQVFRGIGDVVLPHIEILGPQLALIPGDLALSRFEDKLSEAWPRCQNKDEQSFRQLTALYRAARLGAEQFRADLTLIDVGPNLGAINRSALLAADFVVVPLAPDLFSLQGLRNLGPQLFDWRSTWSELRTKSPAPDLALPSGSMQPLGYAILQHAMRDSKPVKAHERWMNRIPAEYSTHVLRSDVPITVSPAEDANCLAALKNYRSLMPLAMEARKPMFLLKPADGAIGAHTYAVRECFEDFKLLAKRITDSAGITPPLS